VHTAYEGRAKMRVKVLNVLTVCAITLAVLSPEILVLSIVWGRHIELIKTQSLTCEINNNIRVYDALALQSEGKNLPLPEVSPSKFVKLNVPHSVEVKCL
jgi:hypothetical protein